ncbi:hypothetical protein M3I54_40680 [Paraburkholderia sp. CNPSo 3274]|uniref:replication protein C, IncQ-type n=1 Tax=Paraburkholderia sp. CNPSo 3274 TaxID=2940932 RepID=UPI0020B8D649|nr:replication protein C, IncQ-type [Paraburkholderia sp. CNPSo 3274]MCP3713128.1 hypothetical protein [Paraburkholderia sp. CNPSo 3274]
MSRANLSRYAKLDPAHVLDGLFVPTSKKGEALYDVCGKVNGGEISFKGVQLSSAHQSVLLAIAARTGRQGAKANGLIVAGTENDLLAQQLFLLEPTGKAKEQEFSQVECAAYALLRDAGMDTGSADYRRLRELLHEMATVVMYRGVKGAGGTSRLLSYQHHVDHFIVSLNWRMADAIFGGQNIQVSLHERLALSESPVAKILHTWLSAYIRPGSHLMAGRGADIDSLVSHVWGKRPCSDAVNRQRRGRIRDALDSVGKLRGWAVRLDGPRVYVSRPRLMERASDPTPGELLEMRVQVEQLWAAAWDCEPECDAMPDSL